MRKRIMTAVLASLATVACVCGLAACGGKSEHSHNFTTTVEEPTCGVDGYTLYNCECGWSYTDVMPATGAHTFVHYIFDDNATCVADGTETAKCENCDAKDIRAKSGTATGIHVFEKYTYNNDATCVADGTETAKCKYCDEQDTHAKNGTATGEHTFETYTYNNDATCVTDGTETATCEDCDEQDTRTKSGTATGEHVFENYIYNDDATCVADGTETATCEDCDEQDTRTKSGTATGEHVFENYIYNDDATCVVDGTETSKCTYCDEQDTQTKIGTAQHTYVDGICSACGELDTTPTEGLSYSKYNKDGRVIGYSVSIGTVSSKTNIYIPDAYENLPVVAIEYQGFKNYTAMQSVRLPIGLEYIENSAFEGCTALTNIDLPSGLKEIGSGAFGRCDSLQSVVLPDSVTRIRNGAFWGRKMQFTKDGVGKYLGTATNPYFALIGITTEDATEYEVNNNTVIIADWAFADGYGLQSCSTNGKGGITIPTSVRYIGSSISLGIHVARIAYKGTKSQWKAIEKEADWYDGHTINSTKVQIVQIICSDGGLYSY